MLEAWFQLGWKSHGGQGLGYGLLDAYELPLDKIQVMLDRIKDQRAEEARRITAASKGKR